MPPPADRPAVDINRLVMETSRRYDVDPRLIFAIIEAEGSKGNPLATGPVLDYGEDRGMRAMGIMQLIPSTARRLGVREPFDAAQNIDGGVRLLRQLLDQYGDPVLAVQAYHGGQDQRAWGPRTQRYLNNVIGSYRRQAQNPSAPPAGQPSVVEDPLLAFATGAASAEIEEPPELGEVDPRLMSYAEGEGARPPRKTDTESWGQKLRAGFERGARDVLDPPAEWLAGKADQYGVTEALRNSPLGKIVAVPTAPELVAQDQDARNAFDRDYQGSAWAAGGRVGGQAVASAPILASGARLTRGVVPFAPTPVANALNVAAGTPGATTGNALANVVARGVGGAAGGATAGYLAADPNEDLGDQVTTGAIVGGVGNAVVAPMIAAGAGGLRRAFAPGVDPLRRQVARRADDVGLRISGGQVSSSPVVSGTRMLINDIPFSGESRRGAQQQSQLMEVLLRQMGRSGNRLTLREIEAAKRVAGTMMDDIAKRTVIVADQPFNDALDAIERDAGELLQDLEFRHVWRQIREAQSAMRAGSPQRTGEAYLSLTRYDSPLSVMQRNPKLAQYANRIRNSLEGLLERNATTEDVSALRRARYEWRVANLFEDAARENPSGVIDPGTVGRILADEGGDLGKVRDATNMFLVPEAERMAQSARWTPRVAAGGLVGQALLFGVAPSVVGKAAGSLATTSAMSNVIGRALDSNIYRQLMIDRGPAAVARAWAERSVGRPGPAVNALARATATPAMVGIVNQDWQGPQDESAWELPPVIVEGQRP